MPRPIPDETPVTTTLRWLLILPTPMRLRGRRRIHFCEGGSATGVLRAEDLSRLTASDPVDVLDPCFFMIMSVFAKGQVTESLAS